MQSIDQKLPWLRSGGIMGSLKADWVLALFLMGLVSSASTAVAQTPGAFTPTGDMTAGRLLHTATLLPDGRVLITGGVTNSLNSITATADLYDPATGMFVATGQMTTARRSHTATVLPDGRVLSAGGQGPRGELASAEVYDSSAGTFARTGDMISGGNASGGGQAMLLPNGKVFIAVNRTAQLYAPDTGTFTATGPYAAKAPAVYTPLYSRMAGS
jgi:hypothetical protein